MVESTGNPLTQLFYLRHQFEHDMQCVEITDLPEFKVHCVSIGQFSPSKEKRVDTILLLGRFMG